MGEITETRLLGDFKHGWPELYLDGTEHPRFEEFLNKLEKLMLEYKIAKLDVCWSPDFDAIEMEEAQG
jgi:hypothetical protein